MRTLVKWRLSVFHPTPTSQKEVAPAPGIEGTQGEAGEDHGCAHEGGGKNAVRGKTIRLRATGLQTYI